MPPLALQLEAPETRELAPFPEAEPEQRVLFTGTEVHVPPPGGGGGGGLLLLAGAVIVRVTGGVAEIVFPACDPVWEFATHER